MHTGFMKPPEHCIFKKTDIKAGKNMVYADKEFIAKKIKYYRKKANLTQAELAEKIDVSSKQMSRIEVGAYIPSLPTFLKIIDTLKIDLSEFGINSKKTDKKRDEFIKLIYGMTDSELKFSFEILKNILKNLESYDSEKSEERNN